MQRGKEYVREISIRDLFFHILYRWRSIVIAALVGALILGGYAYISNRSRAKNTSSAAATGEVSSLQANYEASNKLYQSLLEDNRDYRENSIVMKINPYKVWKATTVYAVVMDDAEGSAGAAYNPAVPIAAAYPALIFDDAADEKLKAIYKDVDLQYINEVVSAAAVVNSGSFTVTVIGLTKKMAAEGQKYFENVIQKASEGDIQQIGKHRVVQLSQYVSQTVDTTIESRQANVAKNIATYQSGITTNDTAVSKAPSSSKKSGKAAKKPGVKYAALGLAGGLALMVCLYAVMYLLSGRIRDARELTERFGVPVYGKLNHSRARRPGKGIDRLIEKWEFRKNRTDEETAYENICALIREQGEGKKVLLTGTIGAEKIAETAEKIREKAGEGTEITAEGDFLKNSRAITEAGQAAAVVIVEAQHVSEAEEIRRMTEMLRIGKANVCGAVAV